MSNNQTTVTDYLKSLETQIEKVVLSKSIPALPDNVKELIVKGLSDEKSWFCR